MDLTFLNIIIFILTTISYFIILKPKLHVHTLNDPLLYSKYNNNTYFSSIIYFIVVILLQIFLNIYIFTNKCGGNISDNINTISFLTLIPWTLIFGIIIIIVALFPGFKSVFSDIFGYYYVANSTNNLLTTLLIDHKTEFNNTLQNENKNENEQFKEFIKEENEQNKDKCKQVAESLIKLLGNTSILINKIVPENFNNYWNILTPLMKPNYQNQEENVTKELKNKLLNLVTIRDNIGEGFWYIYTGILVTIITKFYLIFTSCSNKKNKKDENLDDENTNKNPN